MNAEQKIKRLRADCRDFVAKSYGAEALAFYDRLRAATEEEKAVIRAELEAEKAALRRGR